MRNRDEAAKLRARSFRSEMGASEEVLWKLLRKDRLGFRFRRQFAIGRYVTDFYCHEARLAVEVDGEIHGFTQQRDEARDAALAELGVLTYRLQSLALFEGDRSSELSRHLEAIQLLCIRRSGRDPGAAYHVRFGVLDSEPSPPLGRIGQGEEGDDTSPDLRAAPSIPNPSSLGEEGGSVAIIVLAAGLSRRFGTQNKLLIDWEGEPLIRRVVRTAQECGALAPLLDSQVIVVTGHEAEAIKAALTDLPVTFAHNERYTEGMGTSIAVGVRAAPPDASGFLIVPGDMPRLRSETLSTLAGIGLAEDSNFHGVSIATCRATWGRSAPTYFDVRFRPDLEQLEGDEGARSLLRAHADEVWELSVSDAEVSDID